MTDFLTATNKSVINPEKGENTLKLSFISAPNWTPAQFWISARAEEAGRETEEEHLISASQIAAYLPLKPPQLSEPGHCRHNQSYIRILLFFINLEE